MDRGRAILLGLVGAAVFIIPNFLSAGTTTFQVPNSGYLALLGVGTLLAALGTYVSAVSE
jgi:hypothetical protein